MKKFIKSFRVEVKDLPFPVLLAFNGSFLYRCESEFSTPKRLLKKDLLYLLDSIPSSPYCGYYRYLECCYSYSDLFSLLFSLSIDETISSIVDRLSSSVVRLSYKCEDDIFSYFRSPFGCFRIPHSWSKFENGTFGFHDDFSIDLGFICEFGISLEEFDFARHDALMRLQPDTSKYDYDDLPF